MLELNIDAAIPKLTVTVLLLLTSAATSSKIRTYTILEGDNLLVICNTTESSDVDVYWTKNVTKNTSVHPGKRLEILDIKRKDSGEYICHALNTSYPDQDYNQTDVNKTVEVIKVDVQYPGEIDSFYLGPYELMENQSFTITCDFQANPYPIWSIRNRDKDLGMMTATLPASATLVSPPVTCDYSGYWECTGSNVLNHGVNVTRGHNVTVYCTPRPQYGMNQYTVRAKVGQSVQLTMYAQAYPHAKYTWSKDDGTDISNIAIQEDYLDESNLTFPTVSVLCFGNYTLKMENRYGINYAHYQMIADSPPETPTNFQLSDVTYGSVRLQWTSGYDMGSRQHFIIMKLSGNQFTQISNNIYDHSTSHGIDQHWTYILGGLTSDTRYNLTVASQNERGLSGFAAPITFRTNRYTSVSRDGDHDGMKIILGTTIGIIGTLAILAFIVYMVKFRRMRTTYVTIKGKKGVFKT